MFDLGWSELLVIAVVAIIVVGPKDLPRMMRSVGQWVRRARSLAGEFQRGIEDMVKDDDLDKLKQDFRNVKKDVENIQNPAMSGGSIGASAVKPPATPDPAAAAPSTPAPEPAAAPAASPPAAEKTPEAAAPAATDARPASGGKE